MNKSAKPIFIVTICIVAVIAIFSAISVYNYQKVPNVDVSELPFGIIWGTSLEEAEKKMESLGYTKYVENEGSTQKIVYTVTNYHGMEGVNGQAFLLFDENFKCNEIILYFQSIDTANGMCDKNIMKSYYKSLRKSLNSQYEQVSNDYLEDYEYWSDDSVFITMFYDAPQSLTIDYADKNNITEELKN